MNNAPETCWSVYLKKTILKEKFTQKVKLEIVIKNYDKHVFFL